MFPNTLGRIGFKTRNWQGIFHVNGPQPRESFMSCPRAGAKILIFNIFTYMGFLEFCTHWWYHVDLHCSNVDHIDDDLNIPNFIPRKQENKMQEPRLTWTQTILTRCGYYEKILIEFNRHGFKRQPNNKIAENNK